MSSLQSVVTICVHHARIYFTFTDSVEETTRRLALMMKHDGRSAKAVRHNQMKTTCRGHCRNSNHDSMPKHYVYGVHKEDVYSNTNCITSQSTSQTLSAAN